MKRKHYWYVAFALAAAWWIYTQTVTESMENIATGSNNSIVCVYAYYEKNSDYKNNLVYFLNNGGLLDNIDYYFVINGECSVEIPTQSNIRVVHRENKGFDFGAWEHAINAYIKTTTYDFYVFINSSVIGPYLPTHETSWVDAFIDLFKSGPDVKLVGTSINTLDFDTYLEFSRNHQDIRDLTPGVKTHVQSMFFVLNAEGFDYLQTLGFFDDEERLNATTDIDTIIISKEIQMSQLILANEWNINCYLPKYSGLDYRTISKNINPSGSDPYYLGAYFGGTIQPTDVIFYKNNRF